MSNVKYKIVGDRIEEIREVTVYHFSVGDVDDPDIYAAHPLQQWAQSEQGQWVIKNALEMPMYHHQQDFATMGYKYVIRAKFMGPALTEWLLRYGR